MKKLFSLSLCIFIYPLNLLNAQTVLFNNPNEAVNFALQNSQVYTLKKQRSLQDMKAAKWGIQDFLPTFSFSISEADSTALVAGDTRSKSFQATVSQELFDGGRKKFVYDINRLSSMYAYREYESSLMEFSSQIISLYYQHLMQRQMVLIKEDLVSAAKNQLEIIQKEVEIGITLETDYLEYLISYIQLENDRDQARRDLSTLERQFKIAIDLNYEAQLTITDNFYHEFASFYYEPYIDYIWTIIKNASTEIKKQHLSLEYARKQLAYSRRWYVPTLSVQGGISFSGEAYPLTEPKYTLKLTVDFSNAGLFPLSLSNGYGFDHGRLYSVNNSASVTVSPQPAYGVQRKLADISLLETNIQRIQTERDIHEAVYNLVISHDNALRYVDMAERTILVMERRLEFSRREVEQGEKKHIDYLEELINMAQTKISLLEYQTQASSHERSLEILARFPFGDLRNVCERQNL
jgi:outer membrane protein TolC